MATLEAHRRFFAELITAKAGTPKSSLTSAFAATPRERYLGPGPWKVPTERGYISTPSDDPAFLYQDIVVALGEEQQINNGQPALHALCLAALNVKKGEKVVHIGRERVTTQRCWRNLWVRREKSLLMKSSLT